MIEQGKDRMAAWRSYLPEIYRRERRIFRSAAYDLIIAKLNLSGHNARIERFSHEITDQFYQEKAPAAYPQSLTPLASNVHQVLAKYLYLKQIYSINQLADYDALHGEAEEVAKIDTSLSKAEKKELYVEEINPMVEAFYRMCKENRVPVHLLTYTEPTIPFTIQQMVVGNIENIETLFDHIAVEAVDVAISMNIMLKETIPPAIQLYIIATGEESKPYTPLLRARINNPVDKLNEEGGSARLASSISRHTGAAGYRSGESAAVLFLSGWRQPAARGKVDIVNSTQAKQFARHEIVHILDSTRKHQKSIAKEGFATAVGTYAMCLGELYREVSDPHKYGHRLTRHHLINLFTNGAGTSIERYTVSGALFAYLYNIFGSEKFGKFYYELSALGAGTLMGACRRAFGINYEQINSLLEEFISEVQPWSQKQID